MFRRDVKSLESLCLKAIASRPKEALTPRALASAHRILKPDQAAAHKAKQKLLNTLLDSGRMNDDLLVKDLLPERFFHESLRKLSILGGKVTGSFLQALSLTCPNLKEVNLSGCFKIGDNGVLHILQKCASLSSLNLENCRKLSDASLTHMIHHGQKLSTIDVGGNFNMTTEGIANLVQNHANRSKFVGLHVSGHALPDWLLQLITDKLKQLQHLSIGYTDVQTANLISLLTRRPHLRRLRCHWCPQLDEAFIKFVPQCPALDTLDLTGIKGISDRALLEMMDSKMRTVSGQPTLPKAIDADVSKKEKRPQSVPLARLHVRYCGFTKDTLAYLAEAYPSVQLY